MENEGETEVNCEKALDVEEKQEEDDLVLQFLDSVDLYLTLLNSLSSSLRQGWLDLASARHSMGYSRVSSTLFMNKRQPAATTVQVIGDLSEHTPSVQNVQFALSKWGRKEHEKPLMEGAAVNKNSGIWELRHRGQRNMLEGDTESTVSSNESANPSHDDIQKERLKALSVFGTLVSPKLRIAQCSFEKAVDIVVEIANTRSSMLAAFSQLEAVRSRQQSSR